MTGTVLNSTEDRAYDRNAVGPREPGSHREGQI